MEKVNEFDLDYRDKQSGVKYFFKGPTIDWGVLKFLPGQQLGKHYHNEVEETFYFTKGTPLIFIDTVEYRVKEGDVYRIDPRETHNIVNDTGAPIEAVFIKSSHKPQDKVNVEE